VIAPGPGPNVLMLYPRFNSGSFWDNRAASEAGGARMLSPPLGLITVAAMLPAHWPVRFLDLNCTPVADADFAWADLVMTGGMLPQQAHTLEVIRMCHARGKPVVVGGPDISSSPQLYDEADFKVIGEAELVIADFIAAWERGDRRGSFVAEKFTADVTRTPVPRFELLTFKDYLRIGVQFSRGCPFNCEFCDIIELYGRVPRVKTPDQMLVELDALYALGFRGRVDFVDDNLVGNKKALRELLPRLIEWQRAHGFPFEFSTEASVNIAADDQVLAWMRDANFFAFFVGIESPDEATLVGMQKKQNTMRDLVESVHKINAHGMWVTAGFILGFDTERSGVADSMVRFIEESAIPICMVGLLYALPNTQLTRRLEHEGRLFVGNDIDIAGAAVADQCVAGINFETLRPRREILADYVNVLERIYAPSAFFARVGRMGRMLKPVRPGISQESAKPAGPAGPVRRALRFARSLNATELREGLGVVWLMASRQPRLIVPFARMLFDCVRTNPEALKAEMSVISLYLHVGPFSRTVIREVRRQIDAIDRGVWQKPGVAAIPA